jgi:hypothetical protein
LLDLITGLLAAFDLSMFGDLLEAMPRPYGHGLIEAGFKASP